MAKTVEDTLNLFQVLVGQARERSAWQMHESLLGSWSHLCIATVKPSEWRAVPASCRFVPEATEQMASIIRLVDPVQR